MKYFRIIISISALCIIVLIGSGCSTVDQNTSTSNAVENIPPEKADTNQSTPTTQPNRNTSNCDANYSGACVPIDSDVDCAGGSGNGPSYVKGPVKVIGTDIYGLDRDKNGIGCE